MTNATSTSFEFLAKNDGRSQGVIRFTSFTFGARDREQSFPIDQTVNKGVLLAAGGTMSMTIAAPASEFEQFCAKIPVPPPAALPTPGNILPPPLRSLTLKISASTFHCGVHFSETSFYDTADRSLRLPCASIPVVSECLGKLYDQMLKGK